MGLDVIWLLVITDVPWRGVMQCLLLLGQDESRSAVEWNVPRPATSHQPAYFPSHQPPDTGPRSAETLTEAPRWRAAPRRPAQPRTEQ